MPPKKKLKPDKAQISMVHYMKRGAEGDSGEILVATPVNVGDSDAKVSSDVKLFRNKPIELAKCLERWLKIYPWLYAENGRLYCRPCISHGKNNALTEGCTNFRTSTFSRHEVIDDHKTAVSVSKQHLSDNFDKAVSNALSKEDESVMKMMKSVVWLAQENLPLSKFDSLIHHLISELKVPGYEALEKSSSSSKSDSDTKLNYQSYNSANEMLTSVAEYIDTAITKKLHESPCVSVLADESTDVANKKRMTLNAIVVDPNTSLADTIFLRNVEYEDGTGIGLAGVISDEMSRRNIPFDKVIGFGSDGASVMTGSDKGVKGVLLRKQPHLIHIHCLAHRLALCTSQAAESIQCISDFQRFLTNLFYYFKASASREQELHKVQDVLSHPILRYKEIHAVRWLSCFEAVDAVYRTLDPLISYFHQRVAAKDPKSKGLLKKMATTDFVYITYLLMDVLPIVMKLCLKFQEKSLDIGQAKVALNACLADLTSLRDGEELFPTHLEHYNEDVTEVDGRAQFKGHVLTKSNTKHDQMKVKFINCILTNLNKRFPQKQLLDAFYVLCLRTINFESDVDFGNNEIEILLSHFGEEKTYGDLTVPAKLDKDAVRKEWRLTKQIVKSLKYPVDNFKSLWCLLTQHHGPELPNIIKLAQIAAALPLHTADCERVFSQQNKIITKHRCKLSSDNLDHLLKVRLSKDLDGINYEEVLDIWRRKRRRLSKK